jgi:diguanylate cyclase (GGDEF)-like protein
VPVLTDDVAAAALDALPSFVAVVSPEGTVVRLNEAWRRSAATGLAVVPVRPGGSWLAACDAAAQRGASAGRLAALTRQMLDQRRDRARVEVDAITPRGRRWLDVRLRPIAAGLGVVVVVDDVTERHERELVLRHQASHDAVTGLLNRRALREVVAAGLTRDDPGDDHRVAVVFCDLDAFRRVNQTHGYAVGDATLRAVGERLAAAVAPSEVVGRWGGDEFVAVSRGATDADAVALAARLGAALTEPLLVEGVRILVTASVGLALSGSLPQPDADLLVRTAGEELVRARSRGRRPAG